jgi:hypothetical protein
MNISKHENIFQLSINETQAKAKELIGRKLTDDEIISVKKVIEEGLSFDLETVFQAAIQEATEVKTTEYKI